jgi:hypothetical protein
MTLLINKEEGKGIEMKVNYNLTEEDYINFNLYHLKNSKTGKKALNMQRFLSPVIFMVAAYVISTFGGMPLLSSFIIFFITSVLWVIFYPKYFYSLITRNVKKMIKEGKNDGLLGDHSLIMTDEGIVDTSSNRETKVTWSGIESFKEDNDNLYLYISSVSAYILPKRELHHVDELRDIIKSKVKH